MKIRGNFVEMNAMDISAGSSAEVLRKSHPTNFEVRDVLRIATRSQLGRQEHVDIFSLLYGLNLIAWECRLGQASKLNEVSEPMEIAIVTLHGYAALDWLDSIARSPQWGQLQYLPYGGRINTP